MAEFGGVRITGFDTFDVLVKDNGYTYILPFSLRSGRLYEQKKPYGPTIETCAAEGFATWRDKRLASHAGTDMV